MLRLLADHDVEGQVQALVRICTSPGWAEFWEALDCKVESFDILGLPHNTVDSKVWQLCKDLEIILITGNRNAEDESSLELTIRKLGTAASLPVITIGDSKRLMRDGDYAEAAAAQLIQTLIDLDILLGTGRLFIP